MTDSRRPDGVTAQLARLAVSVREETLGADDSELMRLLLLDSVGCAVSGGRRPPLRSMVEAMTAGESGGHPVWGTSVTASMRTSVLLSAALIHGFEFDDQCIGAGLHAGSATVPTSLALARLHRPSGRELLTAVRAGTEVGIALGRLLRGGPSTRGFHIHSWTGALASAAAASALLGLGVDETMDAFGLAGAVTGGFISAQYGTETKRLQAGHAAEAGIVGATLAAAGLQGIAGIVERPDGGIAASIGGMAPDELSAAAAGLDPAARAAGRVLAFKAVPCKISIQSAYANLDRLIASGPGAVDQVDRIHVRGPAHLVGRVGHQYVPGDEQYAQASLRWILAKRVLSGKVDVNSFEPSSLTDPAVVEFANSRIDLEVDYGPSGDSHGWTTTVTVRTKEGDVLESPVEDATPWFPGHHDSVGIKAKFLDQTTASLGAEGAQRLMDVLWNIDASTDAYAEIQRASTADGGSHRVE